MSTRPTRAQPTLVQPWLINLPRWLTLAVILMVAFRVRTHELAQRPMHADEANQAVKFGELLESGEYAFDPRDHHGPTLYYAALPIAWLRGEHTLAELSETTVRLVPALFGTLSVALLVVLGRVILRPPGPPAPRSSGLPELRSSDPPISWPALAAGAFLAVSPPAVYYSRYFIQETLLVTFTLAAFLSARAWWLTRLMRWAITAGVCVGLMQATKASAPLFVAAALIAMAGARASVRSRSFRTLERGLKPAHLHILVVLGAALATCLLLYSSFGTHLSGLRDALSTYSHAFARFGAEAGPTGHEKPWWYYLRLFGWYQEGGVVWHQVAFSVLAVSGVIVALVRREAFLLGVAIYSGVVIAVFSLFAYKTPWHAVHFIPGMALLAGGAIAAIARLLTGRLVGVAFSLITIATLFQQTQLAAFVRPADQRNPYAYVHSTPDVLKYRPLAEAAIARSPGQPIRVISEEYWPLPWYLRGLPLVGYWTTPPENCDGALVIASAGQADAVRARLHGEYQTSFLGLRPGVICILFTPQP